MATQAERQARVDRGSRRRRDLDAAEDRRAADIERAAELFPAYPPERLAWVVLAVQRLRRQGNRKPSKARIVTWLKTNVPEMDPDTGQPKGESA